MASAVGSIVAPIAPVALISTRRDTSVIALAGSE
jgi:hypothetical protein